MDKKPDVSFLGWQQGYGHTPAFPLFNYWATGMFRPTTVSDATLKAQGVQVPAHPTYEDWLKLNGGRVDERRSGGSL